MTRLELVQGITDAKKFAEMIHDLVTHTESTQELTELLQTRLKEDELQTLKSIARDGYPLSFSGRQ